MNDRKCMKNISECLNNVMNEKGWSIMELSIMCDLSYHTMRNIVNGNAENINLSTIEKISSNIGIPFGKLMATESFEEGYRSAISQVMKMISICANRNEVLRYE